MGVKSISVIEYDFMDKHCSLYTVKHGSSMIGKNIVFAENLCSYNDNCVWCEELRKRIRSRSNIY